MPSRTGSVASGDTVEDNAGDTKMTTAESLEVDDVPSDVPARTATPASARGSKKSRVSTGGAKKPRPRKGQLVWTGDTADNGTEDEASSTRPKKASPDPDQKSHGTAVGTRRQANGTVGSVYSGSKIRHIKHPDGEPLWRSEIQYAFLNEVVTNKERCFTRYSDKLENCTFADIYVDCMARSSKASKILKDRLYVDRPAAENMAMICLLVNVGRMNTTLNFFPEMRAQLRTYHPIPALQAYPTQKDYKSLQDAPRLKSILKGASEDTDEPRTLQQLRALPVPRTNPVNVIFVLAQAAGDVSQLHFTDKVDFFDLAIRPTISSTSRARAFLWLMWWYLESNFDKESALKNPFGPGEYRSNQDPDDPNEIPTLVPKLEMISEEEGRRENEDPEEEVKFGNDMREERKQINAKFAEDDAMQDMINNTGFANPTNKRLKRTIKEAEDSDLESTRGSPGVHSTRSPAPGDTPAAGLQADSIEDDWEAADAHPGRGRYKRVRGKNTPSRSKMRASDGSALRTGKAGSRLGIALSDRGTPDTHRGTPVPTGNKTGTQRPREDHAETPEILRALLGGQSSIGAKSRARTSYQRELEQHRRKRIEWLLNKKMRVARKEIKAQRDKQSWLFRSAHRIGQLEKYYDSDEAVSEVTARNGPFKFGGVIPRKQDVHVEIAQLDAELDNGVERFTSGQSEDYGEEADSWVRTFARAARRLDVWSGDQDARICREREEAIADANAPPGERKVDKLHKMFNDFFGVGLAPLPKPKRRPASKKRVVKQSLDDEITQDLLAERSNDEDEDVDEDVDMADGDAAISVTSSN